MSNMCAECICTILDNLELILSSQDRTSQLTLLTAMGWIGPLFPTGQDQKKTFELNMELELERELIAFIDMRFDFQVASLCLCISYEMLFILFYLFISLGAS